MEFFQNATADLHIGLKVAIVIVFTIMGLWAGWSIIKLILNMFGLSFKKEEQENVKA
jgi:hypothetical protein